MGTINHDAIVVTGWNQDSVSGAHRLAIELGLPVSDLVPGGWNGYVSFLIAPDGSKEFWEPSDKLDAARRTWRDAAGKMAGLEFVWIRFGELEKETEGSWANIVESNP